METDSLQHREVLYSTIEDAFGKVVYTYTTQVIHAGRLKRRNDFFKWLQIIASAVFWAPLRLINYCGCGLVVFALQLC